MAPGGLAEHGDAVGIAAEGADVCPHPGERGDLVAQAEVGGVVTVAKVEEPVGARPPVDRSRSTTPSRAKRLPSKLPPEEKWKARPGLHTITGRPPAPGRASRRSG